MLEKVRLALRLKNTAYDEEIIDIIEAAKLDLKGAGVKKLIDEDPLIRRAIIIYSKANFGLNNPDAEKYQQSFTTLKEHMAVSSDYNTEPGV